MDETHSTISDYEKEVVANYFSFAHVGALIHWVTNGMKTKPGNELNEILSPLTPLCLEYAINFILDKHNNNFKEHNKSNPIKYQSLRSRNHYIEAKN